MWKRAGCFYLETRHRIMKRHNFAIFTVLAFCFVEIFCQNRRTECYYEGKIYQYGEAVPHVTDPCVTCFCNDNWNPLRDRTCVAAACAPIPEGCIKKPGTCCDYDCPKEISCLFDGKAYKENDEIAVDKNDPCKKCICTPDWNPLAPSPCLAALCGPIPEGCTPKPGTCCEYDCPKEISCLFDGKSYKENDEIAVDKSDPCKKCICTADWDPLAPSPCLAALCAPIPEGCSPRPGTCCEYDCPPIKESVTCLFNGVTYQKDDRIAVDPNNPCKKCVCTKDWNPSRPFPCFTAHCAPIPPFCTYKVGTCCGYDCPTKKPITQEVTCEYDGRSYKKGERFALDPINPCVKCVCTKNWNPSNPHPCFSAACSPIPRGCRKRPRSCCGYDCD